MTFKQRLPYFLGGLTIGIIVVAFIWSKKNTSFDYGPNARVLKNISIKEKIYSEEAIDAIQNYTIDTTAIATILKNGNVDIWNKVRLDSCIQYNIKGRKDLKNITLTVKNCESNAFIVRITID